MKCLVSYVILLLNYAKNLVSFANNILSVKEFFTNQSKNNSGYYYRLIATIHLYYNFGLIYIIKMEFHHSLLLYMAFVSIQLATFAKEAFFITLLSFATILENYFISIILFCQKKRKSKPIISNRQISIIFLINL